MPQDPGSPPTNLASHKPTVWELRRRRKAGEALTDAERAIITTYESKYKDGRKSVYLPLGELEDFVRLAEAKGMDFSPWLVHQVRLSLVDKSPNEKRLEEDLNRTVAERDNLRSQVGQLATENADCSRRVRNLVDDMRKLAVRLAEREDEKA